MTEEDIKSVFEQFGEVQHIRINQGSRADAKNGFGFVTFKSEDSVKNALEKKVSSSTTVTRVLTNTSSTIFLGTTTH